MPFVIAVIAIAGSACGEREDAGAPAPARIEQEIRSEAITDASGRVRYIVVMRDGATKAFAKTARNDGRFGKHHKPEAKNLVVDFERRHAFTAVGITSWVNTSFTAYLTPAQVAALRNDPRVERISRDAKASFSFDARSVWTDTQNRAETISWGRKAVAPNTTASTGWSRVYVIDTGVGAHSDLNVVQRVNAADWSLTDAAHTIGCYAHSTHVAGIIGAFANGTGVQGIDPGVAIVSISALDPGIVIGGCLAEQGPETSNVHRALDWVYQDIAARGRVGIVNISINSPIGFDANTGEAAIAMRRTATPTPGYPGAFIVQSAGNNYVDACGRAYNAPAAGDGIMVVGAINDHGQPVTPLNSLNGFRNGANAGSEPGSNYGACVEAWAPGASIISTWSGGGTAPLSGTSMAAPHVAGLAAWFAEAYRLNTPADIEQLVRASMYSLQTTDRTGRTVSLPSLNGAQPTSTPYAEFRVSTEQFASPFNYTNIEDKPANGNLVVYNDEAQQFTWSFDSIGGGFWYCDIVQNGQLLAYAQRYYAPAVSLGTFTFGSTICPSASARVEYRPAPRATWLVNWADMTGGTVNYSPGSATIGFTSVNAQQCDLERAIKDTWTPGYAPIDTIRNVGLSNYSLNRFIIAQNGNYRYGLVCRDAFNVTRTAYLYLNVTLPPPAPDSGMWWNPARSGNGWSISVNSGGTLLLYWLTYTPWGSPTWYYATANLSGSNYSGTLYSAAWNGNSASLTPRGSVLLTPSSTRAATISWSLDGVAGSESIEYMLFGGSGWVPRLTGGWYPPSQPGWGLALDVQGNTMVAELLVYDWGGQPIWLYGAGDVTNAFYLTLSLVTGTNLCPSCTGPTSTSFSPAGSMQVWGVDGSASNAYLYTSVSPYWQWNRSGVSITRLTF